MENVKTYKKIILTIIGCLVITQIFVSLFFYQEIMFRTNFATTLNLVIIAFLVLFGYVKFRAGEKVFATTRPQFLILTVAGLLIYIVLTSRSHRKQVEVFKRLGETSNSK